MPVGQGLLRLLPQGNSSEGYAVCNWVYGALPWSAGATLPPLTGEAGLRPHSARSMASGAQGASTACALQRFVFPVHATENRSRMPGPSEKGVRFLGLAPPSGLHRGTPFMGKITPDQSAACDQDQKCSLVHRLINSRLARSSVRHAPPASPPAPPPRSVVASLLTAPLDFCGPCIPG